MKEGHSAFDRRMTRRDMLQLLGASSATIALVAACGTGGQQSKGGSKEFHGAWPYEVPPNGHFNIVEGVPHSIIFEGRGPYADIICPSAAMYYWKEKKWLNLLGESWSTDKSASTFTLKLKSGLKWSDGKSLTSKDLVTTLWLVRVLRNPVWDYIDKVEAKDDLTVVVHMSKPSTVVERYVLKRNIYSDATYGEFARRAQDLFNAGKDLSSPEGATLNTDLQKLRPDKVVASGPFTFDYNSITNSQLTLVKNPQGVNADKVQFDKVVLYNGETPDVTPVVLDKKVDYATHGFPPATEQSFQQKGLRILRPPTYSGPALLFNLDKVHEFADKRARQAIAHIIDRDQNGKVSLGQSGKGTKYLAGFSDVQVPDWLSSSDQQKLNKYAHDTQKAADLLTAAGWKKNGSAWQKPDGSAAEYELKFVSDFADWSAAAQDAADQLTRFGIKVTTRPADHNQEPIDIDKGDFQLGIQSWGSSQYPHPHFSYVQDLFTHNIPIAANNGGKGMGFELNQTTDAFGAVDFGELTIDSGLGLDEAAQKDKVTRAAIAFNELLPMIPLFERYGNNPILPGVRVQGWPSGNDPILENAPYADNFIVMMILSGDLKPA